MTDWRFEWESPPLTDGDWSREFDKYRASPEFRKTNSKMTVAEYKRIYWMEYAHRMWGRGLGVYFAVPLAYFCLQGYVRPALLMRLGGFFAAGAAQAGVGWWMVRSGLDDALIVGGEHAAPRVSPYRLATHLTGRSPSRRDVLDDPRRLVPEPEPGFFQVFFGDSFARRRRGPRRSRRLSGDGAPGRRRGARRRAAYNTFPLGRADRPGGVLGPGVFPDGGEVRDHPGGRRLDHDRARLGARNFSKTPPRCSSTTASSR